MNNLIYYTCIFIICSIIGHMFEHFMFYRKQGLLYKYTGIDGIFPMYGVGIMIILLCGKLLQYHDNLFAVILITTLIITAYECSWGYIAMQLNNGIPMWNYDKFKHTACNKTISLNTSIFWMLIIGFTYMYIVPTIEQYEYK